MGTNGFDGKKGAAVAGGLNGLTIHNFKTPILSH